MRGGAKPGERRGGRQKGTPNKATVERDLRAAHGLEAAMLDGLMPLDVMLARMQNRALANGLAVTDQQFAAAVAAAPYIHPKLQAGVFKGELSSLSTLSPVEREKQLADLLKVWGERASHAALR
jgi:hypothetical protein